MVDWERQLSDIIDDDARSKPGRRGPNESYSRSVLYPPPPSAVEDRGSRIFRDVLNDIDRTPCGPHQKAAIEAFHATRNGTRPLSRGGGPVAVDVRNVEARVKRSVDRMVDDKLAGSSRAIDALRDQLSVLADEVRQLNRSASSQERRADALRHDADRHRGVLDSVEAHMEEVAAWRQNMGSEISRMKQAFSQQREDVASRATLVEVKAGLESTRQSSSMSIDAAVSPLHASMRKEMSAIMGEIHSLRESTEKQISDSMERQRKEISDSTQTFQRNLVETIQRVVKEEAALTKKKCIDAFEVRVEQISMQSQKQNDKENIKLITKIVTTAATKIESNLKEVLLAKLERGVLAKLKDKRQNDMKLMKKQVKNDISGELSSIKELLKQATAKQTQCISKKRLEAEIESCQSLLTENMKQLEARLGFSRSEKDHALEAMTLSLSSHNSLLENLKKEQGIMHDKLHKFVTKEDAGSIIEDKCKEQYERCRGLVKDIDHSTNDRVRSGIDECKAQLTRDLSTQLQNFFTKEEASIAGSKCKGQYEQCIKLIKEMEQMNRGKIYSQVSECKAQQLQTYITKEDAGAIAAEQYARCQKLVEDIDHITEGKIKSGIEKCKACVAVDLSAQLQNFVTKEEYHGQYERCTKLIRDMENINESKISSQFSQCKAQLTKDLSTQLQNVTAEEASAASNNELIGRCGQFRSDMEQITADVVESKFNDFKSKLVNQNQSFLTEEEVTAIVESKCKEQCDQCRILIQDAAKITDEKIRSQINECKDQLRSSSSDQYQNFITKEDATVIAENKSKEQCKRCMQQVKETQHMTDDRIKKQHSEFKVEWSEGIGRISQLESISDTLKNFATKEEVLTIAERNIEHTVSDRIQPYIEKCKSQLMIESSRKLESLATKAEANNIAERNGNEQFERCTKIIEEKNRILDDRIMTQINSCKEELMTDSSNLAELCDSYLDVVESLDKKVQAIEDKYNDLDKRFESKLDDKNEMEERLESKIASLEEVMRDVPKKRSQHHDRVDQVDDGDARWSRSSSHLHSTLQEAKELVSQSGEHSHCSHNASPQRPLQNEPPIMDMEVMKTPPPTNNHVDESPPSSIVHLLGLEPSPTSIGSAGAENGYQDTPHTPASSPGGSASSEDANGTQQEIILQRNHLLGNVARTLSDVAKKRDDSSLHELAAEMRAGQLETNAKELFDDSAGSQKHDSGSSSSSLDDSPALDSLDSAINTTNALSLCGVQLGENDAGLDLSKASESAESIAGSIDTAEAIALCGLHASTEHHGEDEAENKVSSPTADVNQSQRSISPQPSQSEADPKSPIDSDTMENSPTNSQLSVNKKLPKHQCLSDQNSFSSTYSGPQEDKLVDSGSKMASSNEFAIQTNGINIINEQEDESHDLASPPSTQSDVSIMGSITSFDEVHCIQEVDHERESVGSSEVQHPNSEREYNPSRLSNPEQYEGWDALLSEIKASGLTIQDSESSASQDHNSDNDSSLSSYGSCSFESEASEIT